MGSHENNREKAIQSKNEIENKIDSIDTHYHNYSALDEHIKVNDKLKKLLNSTFVRFII